MRTDRGYKRNGGGNRYQWNKSVEQGEDFADMFANWAYTSFEQDKYGLARENWMDLHMQSWLTALLHLSR